MTISLTFFSGLILTALSLVVLAPLVLLLLLVRDWFTKELW
jgi:hypothetical protein